MIGCSIFSNFDQTMGFYWSYALLLELLVLMRSCILLLVEGNVLCTLMITGTSSFATLFTVNNMADKQYSYVVYSKQHGK